MEDNEQNLNPIAILQEILEKTYLSMQQAIQEPIQPDPAVKPITGSANLTKVTIMGQAKTFSLADAEKAVAPIMKKFLADIQEHCRPGKENVFEFWKLALSFLSEVQRGLISFYAEGSQPQPNLKPKPTALTTLVLEVLRNSSNYLTSNEVWYRLKVLEGQGVIVKLKGDIAEWKDEQGNIHSSAFKMTVSSAREELPEEHVNSLKK